MEGTGDELGRAWEGGQGIGWRRDGEGRGREGEVSEKREWVMTGKRGRQRTGMGGSGFASS